MPDTYRITAPDGTVLKMQLDAPPTDAQALDVVRSYGDAQAAAAQQKAEAGSTFTSQMTPSNLLHDAGTVAGAGWDVLKTLVKEGWKNPLGINQPDIRYDPAAHAQDPTLRDQATSVLGTLRTLPGRAWNAVTDPVGALQAAGVTPDMAAHAGGTVAALGAVGAALPNAGKLTTSAGNQMTRAGQAMNPEVLRRVGGGVGALAGKMAGGVSGAGVLGEMFGGAKVGEAIGSALPAMTRGTGRLITKAGQFMGSATGTPAGLTPPKTPVQPNTLLRADDLKGMLEEAMAQRDAPTSTTAPPEPTVTAGGRPSLTAQQYAELEQGSPGAGVYAGASESTYAPNPVSEPTGPPPRLVKGGGPSLQDALVTALEEVRQGESEPGTTPPERTVTPAGKPSVTPQEYVELEQGSPGAGAYTGTPESAYEPAPERPTGPPPRLVKGEAPSLQDALITALEDVRQEGSEAGTTPPDVTLTEAGKPSVTPERASKIGETAPPAGTTRQIQPKVPPTLPTPGNPIPADDLTAMLEELRQQPANDPATTASGAPPQEVTPGGRPAVTSERYQEMLDLEKRAAARRRAMLEEEVGAQTAASAAPPEELPVVDTGGETGGIRTKATPGAEFDIARATDIDKGRYLAWIEQGKTPTEALKLVARGQAPDQSFGFQQDATGINTEPTSRTIEPQPPGDESGATEGVKPPPPTEGPLLESEQTEADKLRGRRGARTEAERLRREGIDPNATTESVRENTREKNTGETGKKSSLANEVRDRVITKTQELLDSNAPPEKYKEYVAKGRPEDQVHIRGWMEGFLAGKGVPSPFGVVAGAAAGGAALRQALIGQLQGNDKQEQD